MTMKLKKNKKYLLLKTNQPNDYQKMLENKGIVCEIDNGEEAIETVRNNNYDMVLMDVHLPGIKYHCNKADKRI
jgi:CheY-like chemotaxis protein